jgi:hypothetical protein
MKQALSGERRVSPSPQSTNKATSLSTLQVSTLNKLTSHVLSILSSSSIQSSLGFLISCLSLRIVRHGFEIERLLFLALLQE